MKKRLKYLVFIPLMAVLVGSFHYTSVQISYELNKTYIANKLCINKNKPALKCDGKCYLNKQLGKAQKQNNQPNSTTTQELNVSWINQHLACILVQPNLFAENLLYRQINNYTVSYIKSIDHPPTV